MHSHAHHLHADRTVIAVIIPGKLYAHARQVTLARHHNAVQNVSFHPSVHLIERASTTNALIHAHIRAALALYATPAIIIQFALVQLASLATHSHNARKLVSLILHDMKAA